MTKRKTKRVCVNQWGILMYPKDQKNMYFHPKIIGDSRREAIEQFNSLPGVLGYKSYRNSCAAIAKKLWVEVERD